MLLFMKIVLSFYLLMLFGVTLFGGLLRRDEDGTMSLVEVLVHLFFFVLVMHCIWSPYFG